MNALPTPEELVQGQLDAYNSQNLEEFCEFFSDDLFVASYLGDVVCTGIDAFRIRHVGVFSDFPNNKAELKSRIVLGDTVIDLENVTRGNGDPSFQVICIYTISNARISRIEYVKAS